VWQPCRPESHERQGIETTTAHMTNISRDDLLADEYGGIEHPPQAVCGTA
jgi:hypothetical protein